MEHLHFFAERAARCEGKAIAYRDAMERAAGMGDQAFAAIMRELARDAYGEASAAYATACNSGKASLCTLLVRALAHP